MRRVVINKLVLKGKVIGYRYDIMEGSKRITSLDADVKSLKVFKRLLKNKLELGKAIPGVVIHGDLFVTENEERVVQVLNKTQAEKLLKKYYFDIPESEFSKLAGVCTSPEEEKLTSELLKFYDLLESSDGDVDEVIDNMFNVVDDLVTVLNSNSNSNLKNGIKGYLSEVADKSAMSDYLGMMRSSLRK